MTTTTTNTTNTTTPARERACYSLKTLLTRRGVLVNDPTLLREHRAAGIYLPETRQIVWDPNSHIWCETLAHEAVHLIQYLPGPGGRRLRGEPQEVNPRLTTEEASRIKKEVEDYYPHSQWEIEYGAWALEHEPEVVLQLLEQLPPPPPPPPWAGLPTPAVVGMAVAASVVMAWLMLRLTK